MTGDGYAGFYKFSPVFGAFASHGLSEKMRFQYEIIYQTKGSRDPANPEEGKYSSYKITLGYISVPLLWQYDLKKFTLEAGPGLNVLLNSKEENEFGVVPVSNYSWRNFELDAMLGANYSFNDHLFVNARTHHSVTSIVSTTAITPYGRFGGAWNIVIEMTFNYRFLRSKPINFRFRFSPSNFVLFKADFLNKSLKTSSVISSQSFLFISRKLGFGSNACSLCAVENLFQGHTSWHISHPKAQLLNCPLYSLGISSLSSMVK